MKIARIRPGEVLFDIFVKLLLLFSVLATLYPFIYVASMSISSQKAVLAHSVWLWPEGFSLSSYVKIFENPDVLLCYYNTLWYTVVGTTLSVFFTILAAYPLSRKELVFRKSFMLMIVFTMYFSGGMVPGFLLVKKLGMFNTKWAIVIPPLISVFYLIICKTYFEGTAESMIESARLDGANDLKILFGIVLPTSLPIIAVLSLFYAVGLWNSYFSALLYLRDSKLHPIQIYLMRVLIQNTESTMLRNMTDSADRAAFAMQIKYALIMVAMLPVMMVYPFVQKYFVKGVMIGSIKE